MAAGPAVGARRGTAGGTVAAACGVGRRAGVRAGHRWDGSAGRDVGTAAGGRRSRAASAFRGAAALGGAAGSAGGWRSRPERRSHRRLHDVVGDRPPRCAPTSPLTFPHHTPWSHLTMTSSRSRVLKRCRRRRVALAGLTVLTLAADRPSRTSPCSRAAPSKGSYSTVVVQGPQRAGQAPTPPRSRSTCRPTTRSRPSRRSRCRAGRRPSPEVEARQADHDRRRQGHRGGLEDHLDAAGGSSRASSSSSRSRWARCRPTRTS